MASPSGYAYVGCLDCGRVMTVIHVPGEALPWCNHHTGSPIWRAPHPETQKDPRTSWTQTVPVRVMVS